MEPNSRLPGSSLVVASVLLIGLCVLGGLAIGAVGAQETVDISLQPADAAVEEHGESDIAVVIEGADDGVSAFDISVDIGDTDVATLTNVSVVGDPFFDQNTRVSDDGSNARIEAAMGENTFEPADQVVIGYLTVEGLTVDESTELTIRDDIIVSDNSPAEYAIGDWHGATVSVVEAGTLDDSDDDLPRPNGSEDDDGFGPGFGPLVAMLGAIGALGYSVYRTSSASDQRE